MENKIYLEEFLDKLTKMLETSKTEEQKEVCINFINNYKIQIKEVIENELFREATLNFLDELVSQVYRDGDNKLQDESEEEVL